MLARQKCKTNPMSLSNDIAALFERDLTRLLKEVQAFPDDETLWRTLPGVTNSAGTLVLHLEGNLREYVGRLLGDQAYQRQRELEFSTTGLPASDLSQRVTALGQQIPAVIRTLPVDRLSGQYPVQVFGAPITTQQFLVHLHGHFNYHLGQINYLRRIARDFQIGPDSVASVPLL